MTVKDTELKLPGGRDSSEANPRELITEKEEVKFSNDKRAQGVVQKEEHVE